jgi:hypothetical protein
MTIDLLRQRDELTTAIAELVATIQQIRREARDESLLRQSSRESVNPRETIRAAERRKAQIAEAQRKLMETQAALGAVNKAIRAERSQTQRPINWNDQGGL